MGDAETTEEVLADAIDVAPTEAAEAAMRLAEAPVEIPTPMQDVRALQDVRASLEITDRADNMVGAPISNVTDNTVVSAADEDSEEAPDVDDEVPETEDNDNDFNVEETKDSPTYGRNLIIIGAGGIGGNFLNGFGKNEDHRVIVAIDDDIMELSNFNRIPLPLFMIGRDKVSTSSNIYCGVKRRVSTTEEFLDCMAEVFEYPAFRGNQELWAQFAYRNGIVVVDARDTSNPDAIFPEIDIKLTYDGGDACCIELNPDYGKEHVLLTGGDVPERTYSVTPSFMAPPTMLVWYAYRLIYMLPYNWYATIGRKMEQNAKYFFSLNSLFGQGKEIKW